MPSFLTRLTRRVLPRVKPMEEMGSSGTPVWGGFVQQRERSSDWTGERKWRTASEIAVNVSIVAAGIYHFLNLVARPTWSVLPSDPQNSDAVAAAEFMEDVLYDMETSFNQTVRRSANYRFYGFSIQEWTAKKRKDGNIGLASIEPRPAHTIERWEVSKDGRVEGVWQRSPQTGQLLGIPREKILYLVEDTLTDSPEGLGVLRHLAEPYSRYTKYLELEARAFERDLRGIPIGRVPLTLLREAVAAGQITQQDADKLVQQMEDFVQLQMKQSNTAIVLDSQPYESIAADGPKVSSEKQWDVELMQGSSNGLTELASAIDRLQREMARVIGVEHLMMGDQGGNRALATDKSRNLYLIANSVLNYIVETYQNDVVKTIWKLNGLNEDFMPILDAENVAFKDVEQVTAALRDMATAGAVLSPDDPAINDIRSMLGISRVNLEESPAVIRSPKDPGEEEFDFSDEEDELSDAEEDEVEEAIQRRLTPKGNVRVVCKRNRSYVNDHANP